jgi:hypothetical protein
MRFRTLWVLAALAAASVCAQAQWLNHPTPGTPRVNGKPDLRAKAPRVNGRPDLSGIWMPEAAPAEDLLRLNPTNVDGGQTIGEPAPSRYFMNVLWEYKPDEIVMKPAAAALMEQRGKTMGRDIPSTHCLPLGVPMMDVAVFPHKIVQTKDVILLLYEEMSMFRQVYLDGRRLPVDPEPAYVGYSVGHWDGDTLVVEATGFKNGGWLDAFGHPHSDAMRVTERFRRRDFGTLELQITIDDSKFYNKPFTITSIQRLLPDTDLIETFCENEKDRVKLFAN